MTTWLHDPDALRAVADEPDPAGSWARLQLLARGEPCALPTDWISVGPALALEPTGWDAWIDGVDAASVNPLRKAVVHLGLRPDADPDRWERALAGLLDGPGGADAACALLALGRLTRNHVQRALRHHPEDPAIPAWILATCAESERDAVARELAEALRDDLAHGGESALTSLLLLNGGLVDRSSEDPLEAAQRGAAVTLGELPAIPAKGSVRARTAALVEALGAGRTSASACFVRALAGLRKGPAVPAAAVLHLAWEASFTPSDDPVADVRWGLRGPAVGLAREAARAGSFRPQSVRTPADAGIAAAALWGPEGLALAEMLRDADPFDEGTDLARWAAAAVHPSIVVDLLDHPERRDEGWALAPLAQTAEVLELLLGSPVPAHPGDRRNLAYALARTGIPAAMPVLDALCGHLEPSVVSEVRAHAASILGREV